MLRKIAVAAASKPAVEIKQEGPSFYIKTSTTVRTTEVRFEVGEEFEEQTVDGRPCKVRDRREEGSWLRGDGVCGPGEGSFLLGEAAPPLTMQAYLLRRRASSCTEAVVGNRGCPSLRRGCWLL